MSGDRVLYSPADPREIDAEYFTCLSAAKLKQALTSGSIVFVHGLRGNLLETWSSKERRDFIWPKELLAQDIKRSRIVTWGYDSSVVRFSGASQASIFGHAENLLTDLSRLRGERIEETRPVIFVGHSLGGIVIKQALIRSFFYRENNQDVERGRILSSTKGVVFLGTPHRGSNKTELASLVSNIIKISFQKVNHKLLDAVAEESQILEEQASSFSSITEKLRMVCFAEELPMIGVGIIVPQSSATLPSFHARSGSIQADHVNMCKFSSSDDLGYKRVTQEIKALIKKALEETTDIEQDVLNSLAFEGMDYRENDLEDPWARTFEWLTPGHVDGPDESNNNTARQANQECFNTWLRSSDPQPFWICGKAGSGKSTLMKKLFHQPNFREDVRNWAGATPVAFASFYFFSRGSSLLQKSREGMLRAVLHQIISQHRALARHIEDIVHVVSTGHQERGSTRKIEWDWENLKKALNIIKDQAFNSRKIRLCLFLDGLDEYTAHTTLSDVAVGGRNPTAHNSKRTRRENYKNLCQLVMDLASSTSVKICVSSRDLNQFASTFGESPKLRLEDLSRRDISTYVTGNLDTSYKWASLRSEAPETMENIIIRIIEKASGVFLWVKIVVEQIREAIEDGLYVQELTKFLENIPDELDELFSRMVKDINPGYRGHSATLFQLVLTSETWRPLTAATLYFAETATTEYVVSKISTSPAHQHLDQIASDTELENMRQRLRSHSAGLIELSPELSLQSRGTDIDPTSPIDPGPHVQFIHQTVNDFIESKGGLSKLFPETAGDFSRDSSVRLLRSSILGLSTLHTRFIPDSTDSYHDADIRREHIWRFVHDAIHWARTLDSTEEDADELATLLDCLDAAGEVALGPEVSALQIRAVNHWVASEPQESGGRDYWTQENFLSYTIQAGLENYAQRKLKTVAPKRGKPYLEYALGTKISDRPLAMYKYGKSGTWDAIGVRPASPRFVKYLLDHGADPNEAWTTGGYRPHEHTVWASALTNINFRLGSPGWGGEVSPIYRIAYELTQPSQENRDRQRCIDNLKLLIEYGADVSLDLDGSEGLNTPSGLIEALLAAQRHNLDLSGMLETLDRAVASGLKPSCERVLAAVSGSHVARRDFRTAEGLPEQGAVISGLHPTRRLLKNVSGDPVEAKAKSVTENEVAGSQSSGDESSTIARRLNPSTVKSTQQSAISSGNSNMLSPAPPVSGDTSVGNLSDFPVAGGKQGKSNSKGVKGWMKRQCIKLWKRLRPGKET